MCKHRTSQTNATGATGGDQAECWRMANALRGSMDAAEDQRAVLGHIFLKAVSDAFEEPHAKLVAEPTGGAGATFGEL